jgi:hypothetical protein
MGLKYAYSKKEDIPEELQKYYTEKGGQWVLDAKGAVPKDRLDEFRENNGKLTKELEELKSKLEGIDLDKYNEMIKSEKDKQTQDLIKAGRIEEVINQRVAQVENELVKKIEKLEQERNQLSQKFAETALTTKVQNAVNAVGKVRQGAMIDILQRAKAEWDVAPDGTPVYKDSAKKGLTIEEWSGTLLENAPHLFEGSAGGGAAGGAGGGSGGVIPASDYKAVSSNLEKIAKGEVTVVMEQ